jgi:hypothetical protein
MRFLSDSAENFISDFPSDRGSIVRGVTSEHGNTSICLACGEALAAALERFASLRCHDCRDTGAPIRPELLPSPDPSAARPIRLQAA